MEQCRRRYNQQAFANFLANSRRGFPDRHTSNTRLSAQVRANDIPAVALDGHAEKPVPKDPQQPEVVWRAPQPYLVPTLSLVFKSAGITPELFDKATSDVAKAA